VPPAPAEFVPPPRKPWAIVIALLLFGLFVVDQSLDLPTYEGPQLRTTTTRWHSGSHPRLEHDEQIYVALVSQLETHKGYTLRGSPVLARNWMSRSQYDQPLFFHPPGGIALFWLTSRIAGEEGPALAELLSYGTFFISVLLLCPLVIGATDRVTFALVALLAATTPILLHSAGRLWLDAPLLAFSTLAVTAFVAGVVHQRRLLVVIGGLVLGYASWIKLTALLTIPGAVAIALAVRGAQDRRWLWRQAAVFVGVALAVQLPWELIQWRMTGSPFPAWAGRPSPELVAGNPYVHYLTVVRGPSFYVTMLPQVVWTIVPSLLLLLHQWRDATLRRKGVALIAWIAAVVLVNTWLGANGYSKLLRYVILVTPATVLLFGLVFSGALRLLRTRAPRRALTLALVVLALAGVSLEAAQGLRTALHDNQESDLIVPLTGIKGMTR
jgi:4-amino-4-deoxy-L-arabinose transferase-like glycosyltransferase